MSSILVWVSLKAEAKQRVGYKSFIWEVVPGSRDEGPGRARWELAKVVRLYLTELYIAVSNRGSVQLGNFEQLCRNLLRIVPPRVKRQTSTNTHPSLVERLS